MRRIGSDRRHPAGPRPALASPRFDRKCTPPGREGGRRRSPSSSEHSPTRSAARSPTRFTARASLPSPRPSTASSRAPTSSPGSSPTPPTSSAWAATNLGAHFADLALVEVHLERNDHETAARILHRVTQATEATHRPTLQSLTTLYQAKVARVLGDEIGAEALLGQARRCYDEPDAAVRQTFGEEAVAQALRFDASKASRLIAALDQDRVGTQVLRVRLALVEHDDRAATALLADLPPATTRRTRVERSVLCALSVLARDVEQANRHLREALDAGQPERLIRTVVDQAPGVHHLLLSCAPDASQVRYVEDLLAATSRILPPARADVAPALVEPLTPREVIVLRYLCSRLTYREIAAALYVSLNTLKSHVRSVYRKLAVASRADAVDLGRCRGLI